MQGLMPETVIYGVKPGEKYEEILAKAYTHTITEQQLNEAVGKAEKLGCTNVRVHHFTFADKPDFAKAVNA